MTTIPYRTALIVGAGPGISASVARGLAAAGLKVGLAARAMSTNCPGLSGEIRRTGVSAADATDPAVGRARCSIRRLRRKARRPRCRRCTTPAPGRQDRPPRSIPETAERKAIEISAFGAFLVAQQAVKRMLPNKTRGHPARPGASAMASRATRARRSLRWASLRCAGWRKRRRANWRRRASMLRISSSMAGYAARAGSTRPTAPTARLTRTRLHRPIWHVLRPAAQRNGRSRSNCGPWVETF